MSQYIQGLWIGSGLTREAAEHAEAAIRGRADALFGGTRTELLNLANAVRSEIQKLPPPPKPMSDLV